MSIALIVQIVVVMLLWAACFPLITIGIEFSPHLTFAALRASLAGLTLTILALLLRRPLPGERRDWAKLAIVGLGATTLGFLGMFHAAEFISPGIATVIANTQPLLAAVIASMVLRERLTPHGIAGLFLGFAGILVITAPQIALGEQENYFIGVAYIVMAALGITISNVLIKQMSGSADALMAMGLQMLIGSIPLILGAWIMEDQRTIQWSFTFIGALLTLSLLGTALVYWLWFSVLAKTQLNRANTFSFLIPIFGLTIAAIFYDETLGMTQMAGIAITILGVGLVTSHALKTPLAGRE